MASASMKWKAADNESKMMDEQACAGDAMSP